MPTMEIGPGNSIAFVTATGDELLRQEWNDTEQRVDIIDPDTGNPIGHYDAGGNLTMTGEVTIPNAALGSLTQNLDADGNDLTNVGALGAEKASIGQLHARAGPGSDQNIPQSTSTQVSIGDQNAEDTSVVSVDQNNDKFTVQVDGIFVVSGIIAISQDAEARVRMDIYVNNSFEQRIYDSDNRATAKIPIGWEMKLSANDDVHLEVQSADANPTIVKFGGTGTGITLSRRG